MLEKTFESPLDCKEIQPVYPKGDQSWMFIGRTDAEAETPVLWPPDVESWLILKRPWCWERLKAGGEGDNRRWDGWMASLTRWMWVWVNSGRWWWTGRPSVLQSTGFRRVGHAWVAELTVNVREKTWGYFGLLLWLSLGFSDMALPTLSGTEEGGREGIGHFSLGSLGGSSARNEGWFKRVTGQPWWARG